MSEDCWRPITRESMKRHVALIGRLLLAAIFVISALGKVADI
jgi:hypothetical protein